MYNARLHTVSDKLTKAEKKIADYLEDYTKEGQIMTSYELAKQLNIGQSTIIRFSKKLGYNSFRDLQVDLVHTPTASAIEDIAINESTHATNFKITKQYQEIIDLTYAQNNDAIIEETIRRIKGANRILIHGIGNSNLFAQYFANQLTTIGVVTFTSGNNHVIYSAISCYTPEDLVILISESGETPEILQAAKIAQNHLVPVISMTRAVKNKLYDYSDIILRTVNRMSRTRLETMTMRCSQLCLIDMIYLNLFKTDYERFLNALDNSRTICATKDK
ncbi:MurR/RpiR family transcriptional regulator [Candidatus Merdisoma sp. JLR.KK006]|jgi:DNA-binding MurR/RpiR family transcriptional regulator|uniref:MurR/RpiR family transcriptional regulator n=1 Tax=Candidatus Merdisoma sp. JLR.KK006 TaxID=3112626 RepID=UPI002FF1D051